MGPAHRRLATARNSSARPFRFGRNREVLSPESGPSRHVPRLLGENLFTRLLVVRNWERTGLDVLHAYDFEATHLKRDGTYAGCFGATWCRSTPNFAPKFVAREGRLPARLAVADITDRNDPLWDFFQIKITPTMFVFRDGMPLGRYDGRRFFGLRDSALDRLTDFLGTPVGSVPAAGVPPR